MEGRYVARKAGDSFTQMCRPTLAADLPALVIARRLCLALAALSSSSDSAQGPPIHQKGVTDAALLRHVERHESEVGGKLAPGSGPSVPTAGWGQRNRKGTPKEKISLSPAAFFLTHSIQKYNR